ncbi:uncharacterized protein CEXT_228271 [Caerostris extrusa]|uniref:Uncharacterized protein n=1 Tax=Caerostris extrusa TaxID=172846 RepID=A0AAV4VS97_CAEEX|nr:uncharacterized protein CEXT_228271 [Caerostris extrusa]
MHRRYCMQITFSIPHQLHAIMILKVLLAFALFAICLAIMMMKKKGFDMVQRDDKLMQKDVLSQSKEVNFIGNQDSQPQFCYFLNNKLFKVTPIFITLFISFRYHAAKPYQYEYEAPGEHGMHYKKEESDGHGNVKGSYGYFDDHGTFREVHYVADHNGFRAEIRTNEPGTKDQEHPHAQVFSFVEDEDSESSNHEELQKRSSHGDSDSKSTTPIPTVSSHRREQYGLIKKDMDCICSKEQASMVDMNKNRSTFLCKNELKLL